MGDGQLMGTGTVIGVDVDQVTADLHSVWLDLYNRDYGDALTSEHIRTWHIERYVKPECGPKIFQYLERRGLYDAVEPIEGAREGIEIIRSWGARVVFVTSAGPNAAREKMEWLARHRFLGTRTNGGHPWRDIVVTADKGLVRCDVLVDDYAENLRASSARVRILFDQPHNRSTEWAQRARGWPETIAMLARAFSVPLARQLMH